MRDGTATASWRGLITDRHWQHWTLAGAFTRIPVAMAPLALVLVGLAATGSYRLGAATASAFTIAEALAAPFAGRVLGRGRDLRGGVGVSLGVAVLLFLGLALASHLTAPGWVLLPLAAAAGAVPSGVQGGVRAFLPRLLPAQQHERAFAIDASLLEIEWMAAPALVAITVVIAPSVTVALMALSAAVGIVAVAMLPNIGPETEAERLPGRPGPTWRVRSARNAYIASLLLGYAEGTVTLSIPALLPEVGGRASSAGFVLVALSAASALGGFGYGWLTARTRRFDDHRGPVLLTALGVCGAPLALAGSTPGIVAAVAAFGLFVAPINAVRSGELGRALPQTRHPEGFSILYALNGLGFGLAGLVLAGVGHPRYAVAWSAVITILAGAVGVVSSLRRRRLHP